MIRIEQVEDMDRCRELWQTFWPSDNLFDLWQVRECFARAYDRPNCFLAAKEGDRVNGLLSLCWVGEDAQFCHFPGEIWHHKTWLEQNRIIAENGAVAKALVENIPGKAHVRYLACDHSVFPSLGLETDEKAYMFFPGDYGYDFNTYIGTFSNKTRKKIFGEIAKLEKETVSYRYDCAEDLDLLFQMNLDAFGEDSYFKDKRFLKGFENLVDWVKKQDFLRITTVLIGGAVAAIDLGIIFNKNYTLLAGGTNPEFKGVAKLINFHHIEYACHERINRVEFLCGDFGWKERFHLTAHDLYQFYK